MIKSLLVCLVFLSCSPAHAADCSKGAPPPGELKLQVVSFATGSPVQPLPETNPHFEGTADLHWDDDGRCMTLLSDVSYIDKRGDRWTAWKGMGTDGATIPPVAWSLIGGPYEGPYRRAALVHDAACYLQTRSWQASARMFYEAMLIAGTNRTKALLMFEAVYMFGPKWTIVKQLPPIDLGKVSAAVSQVRIEESAVRDSEVQVTNTATGSAASGNRNVSVKIFPPNPVKFTAADFETLAKRIQAEEDANPGSVTLEEIETYRPAAVPANP